MPCRSPDATVAPGTYQTIYFRLQTIDVAEPVRQTFVVRSEQRALEHLTLRHWQPHVQLRQDRYSMSNHQQF